MSFWEQARQILKWTPAAVRAAALKRALVKRGAPAVVVAGALVLEAFTRREAGEYAAARELIQEAIATYDQGAPLNPAVPMLCLELARLIELDPEFGAGSGMSPEIVATMRAYESQKWKRIMVARAREVFVPELVSQIAWSVSPAADVAAEALEDLG